MNRYLDSAFEQIALSMNRDQTRTSVYKLREAAHLLIRDWLSAPLAIRPEEVDSAVAEREPNVFIEQSRASGKPDNIIEKMVEGRMRELFEEVAIRSQTFVINPDLDRRRRWHAVVRFDMAQMRLVASTSTTSRPYCDFQS